MLRGTISVLALIAVTAAAGAAEPQNPAHAIAHKFAAPTETAPSEPVKSPAAKPPTAKPEPANVGRAKSEPSPPASANVQPAASEPAKAERPPLDYEMEMLRRARAEQADAKPTPAPPASSTAKPAITTGTLPVAATGATPAVPVVSAPAIEASPSAVHTAPAAVTAAPLPATVSQPATAATAPPKVAEPVAPPSIVPALEAKAAPDPKAVEKTTKAPPTAASPSGPAVPATLLLALETSGTSKPSGQAQTFDPVLCLNDDCYISAGLTADAVKLSKSDVLKLKSTDEASPASCKGMIACVYRNVAVPAGAQLKLIELGSATHDASRVAEVKPDSSCKISDGVLSCEDPIATPDFKVWVVGEETARAAGVHGLEEAVADGLPNTDMARASDK